MGSGEEIMGTGVFIACEEKRKDGGHQQSKFILWLGQAGKQEKITALTGLWASQARQVQARWKQTNHGTNPELKRITDGGCARYEMEPAQQEGPSPVGDSEGRAHRNFVSRVLPGGQSGCQG